MSEAAITSTTSPAVARREAVTPAGDAHERRTVPATPRVENRGRKPAPPPYAGQMRNATLGSVGAVHATHLNTVQRIRAAEPVTVTVYQPLPDGSTARHQSRLLAETRINGRLHHYRVALGGFVLLCPPHWLALESFNQVREAGLTVPTFGEADALATVGAA